MFRHVIHLDGAEKALERPAGARNDIHFTEAQIAPILQDLSAPGDHILDPFSGYGTTVVVADRLGRIATGVELQEKRVESSRARLDPASPSSIISGDARELASLGLGQFDLCLTSPPYMARYDHPENPLTAFRTLDGAYDAYLRQLGDVFDTVGKLLTPRGRIGVCVSNFRDEAGRITPLAFDVYAALSQRLEFCGEIYFAWSSPSNSVTGDYCLVFRSAASTDNATSAN